MKFFLNQHSKYSGFTLVEILIVISIIIILSVTILANYEWGGYKFILTRSAHTLAQDIRKAEGMAMLAEEFEGVVPSGGYGVYFDRANYPTSYILFADIDGDYGYDSGEMIEEIKLGDGVEIDHVHLIGNGLQAEATITFTPPDPVVRIEGGFLYSSLDIILYSFKTDESITVSVNMAGLVNIQ